MHGAIQQPTFNKCLLSFYHVPGTVLGNGYSAIGGKKRQKFLPSGIVSSNEMGHQHISYSAREGHFGALLSPSQPGE